MVQARGGSVTAHDLQKSNKSRYRTTEEAAAALDKLAEAGLAEWVDKPAGQSGGRPTRVMVLKTSCGETPKPRNPPHENHETDDGEDPSCGETPSEANPGSEKPNVSEGFGGFGVSPQDGEEIEP
jgi:hypothetical protein